MRAAGHVFSLPYSDRKRYDVASHFDNHPDLVSTSLSPPGCTHVAPV